MNAVHEIVGRHDRVRLRLLHDDLELLQVDLAERALGHAGVRILPVRLLVVRRKVLHARADVAALDAIHQSCPDRSGEIGIL